MTQSRLISRILVGLLSLAGLADSIYFTLAYYGRVRKSWWVPEILCAREGSACVTVVQTTYARIFGVPNSVLGIFYYLLVLGWALGGHRMVFSLGFELISFSTLLVGISAFTVAAGCYLIYALRAKLHLDCPMCYTAHAINAALFLLLWVAW